MNPKGDRFLMRIQARQHENPRTAIILLRAIGSSLYENGGVKSGFSSGLPLLYRGGIPAPGYLLIKFDPYLHFFQKTVFETYTSFNASGLRIGTLPMGWNL